MDTITQNAQTAFEASDSDTTDLTDFQDTLTDSYNTYSVSKLNNPNPAPSKSGGVTQIEPEYITKYGDSNEEGTSLNAIFVEFDAKIKVTFDFRQSAQDATDQITNNSDEIKTKLEDININVQNMKEPFDTLSADVLDTWIEAVRGYFIYILLY